MKNIYLLVLACMFAISNPLKVLSANILKGSGIIVTKTIEVSKIDAIDLKGSMNIIVTQGNNQEIKIETDDNILQYVEYKVVNSKIVFNIKDNKPYTGISATKLNIYLTLEQLKEIKNYGSGDFTINNLIIKESLKIENNGSGDFKGNNFTGEKIEINNSGSGNFIFQGKINNLEISNFGSGNINTFNLNSDIINVNNSGSGNLKVYAEKEISLKNNGSGNIEYKGNAFLKSLNSSGSGKVKKNDQ
jgi:hypothetical protein